MAKSGMELLGSIPGMGGLGGIGQMMSAAKEIADSGAVEKLLLFAQQVEPINEKLDLIVHQQRVILDALSRIGGIQPSRPDGPNGQPRVSLVAGGVAHAGHENPVFEVG